MRPAFGIALLLVLPGCAMAVIDQSAVPQAASIRSLAYDRCADRVKMGLVKSMSEGIGCMIAADRQFAIDIKLKNMQLFSVYQERLVLLGSQADAGLVKPDEFGPRYSAISAEYTNAIVAEYNVTEQRRIKQAQAVAAFGQALQQAGANYRANRPVNCSSVQTGRFTNTTCN